MENKERKVYYPIAEIGSGNNTQTLYIKVKKRLVPEAGIPLAVKICKRVKKLQEMKKGE